MRRDTRRGALLTTAVLLLAACSDTGTPTVEPGTGSSTDGSSAPSSSATSTDDGTTPADPNAGAAEWRIEDLDWPTTIPGIRYQQMTLTQVGDVQLALAGQASTPENGAPPDSEAWRSTDGVSWTRIQLPNLVDGIRLTPYDFNPVVVDGDTVYAISLGATRLVDPGNPDGFGLHAEPSEPVGGLWWSTDAGATWQRTSELVPSRFDSAAVVNGTLWIGGAVGDYPAMTAAVWSFDGATLTARGTIGTPAAFSVVASVEAGVDGAPIAHVAQEDGSQTPYRFDGTAWTATGPATPPPAYAGNIDLGLDGPMDARGPVLDNGTVTVARGSVEENHDLRFCFADPATCRTRVLALAYRASDTNDGWTRLALPDGFLPAYSVGPQLIGDELMLYETDANGVPTRRAVLDLAAGPPPVVVHADPPPLPAPEFDGTLEVGVPEAAEVLWGCGSADVRVNGKDLSARDSLVDVASTDWVQLRIDSSGSEGDVYYFYGVLELMPDGRVEFRATTGQHIGWFDTAIPPEYYCA